MAFESINVVSLRQSLYNCKNSLDYKFSNNFISSLYGDSWISGSKQHLIQAIEKLTNERYLELLQKIDTYLSATNLIEEYQNLNQKNIEAAARISQLEPHLWRSEKYTESHLKADGTYEYIDHWHNVEDIGVKNEISSLRNQIDSNSSQMDVLQSRVSNLI